MLIRAQLLVFAIVSSLPENTAGPTNMLPSSVELRNMVHSYLQKKLCTAWNTSWMVREGWTRTLAESVELSDRPEREDNSRRRDGF